MNTEITNDKGELDAEKLFNQVQALNSELDYLQKKAKEADIMPTKNTSGKWIFKTEQFNSEKIELLGKNAYAQSLVLAELYEIQMQAMQLSVSSFDALKTVNKELTKVINRGHAESGEHNKQLFEKTQEQILRIAKFAKNNADNLEELKNELRREFEKGLCQYVKVDDVGKQIENSLKDYVNNKDYKKFQDEVENNIKEKIKKLEKQLSKFIEADDVEKQIKDAIKTYIKREELNDFQNNIDNQISNLKKELEESVKINQVEEKIEERISVERDNISKQIKEKLGVSEKLIKDIDERIKKIERWINSKQKINGQIICGIVLGSIGTILSLLSIFLVSH